MQSQNKKSAKARGVRLNVSLSEKNYEELNELARQLGMDMSEFVRNSIQLYNHVQKEKLDGRRLYAGRNNMPEVEIRVPEFTSKS